MARRGDAGEVVPTRPASEYRPCIDGSRAIAVLAVFVFHLNRRRMPGGFLGVDIFFVISGYLITSVVYSGIVRQAGFALAALSAADRAPVAGILRGRGGDAGRGCSGPLSPQDLASTGATLSAAAASPNLKFLMQGNLISCSLWLF